MGTPNNLPALLRHSLLLLYCSKQGVMDSCGFSHQMQLTFSSSSQCLEAQGSEPIVCSALHCE